MKTALKYSRILLAAVLLCSLLLRIPELQSSGIPEHSRLTILMYHHVVKDGEATNSVTISEGKLEADLRCLTERGYTTVLPSELLSSKSLPEKAVLISFDDGYRSNYELAFPLLRKYGCKAAIALITSNLDAGMEMFLDWDMCRSMADSGLVEFGSHTHDLHNPQYGGELAPQGPNGIQRWRGEARSSYRSRLRADLETSRSRLLDELGTAPVFFAYPYGATDRIGDPTVDALFPVSVTTAPGYTDIRPGTARMPRFAVREDTDLLTILR